ncbi:MAG: cytochrome C [Hyphomicrobium sp.]
MHRFAILAALVAVLSHGAAKAQDPGDPARGLAYAKRVCAECHGVGANDKESPNAAAPTFGAVANTSGMTGRALVVWMESPHPSMPQLIVPVDDRNDLIAYILGLKDNGKVSQ